VTVTPWHWGASFCVTGVSYKLSFLQVSNLLPQVEKLKRDGCVLVVDFTSVLLLTWMSCIASIQQWLLQQDCIL